MSRQRCSLGWPSRYCENDARGSLPVYRTKSLPSMDGMMAIGKSLEDEILERFNPGILKLQSVDSM